MTIHFDRLLKLADFGETIPEERFCYESFVDDYDEPFTAEPSCGTSGCMLAWAALIPEFRAAGLKISRLKMASRAPYFKGQYGISAGAAFFGLTYEESGELFDPGVNLLPAASSPSQVAAHIRRFVESRR